MSSEKSDVTDHITENNERYHVEVSVESMFVPEQSDPDNQRWVFAYFVRIINRGTLTVRLLTRHWIITDGEERVREVHGEGVVGEQPDLVPGFEYVYQSGVILDTAVGTLQGSYQMLATDGACFDAPIEAITLAAPQALH